MAESVIELYDNFNTKGCRKDLIFGDFNNQPIPSTCFDITNDYDKKGNQFDAALVYKEGVEDEAVPNDENNNIGSLASNIDPPQTKMWNLKKWTEWSMKMKKGKLKEQTMKIKEWTQTTKEWTTKSYLLSKNGTY